MRNSLAIFHTRTYLNYRVMALVVVLSILALLQMGCQNLVRRGQSPETAISEFDDAESKIEYIGRFTAFNNLNYAKVQGIGLVTGLKGTGSDPGPSWQRDHLLDEMRTNNKYDNPKGIVASLDTAIIKVTGYLPPACRKGDRIDLEVEILEGDDVSSIHGGFLEHLPLKPVVVLNKRIREGSTLATGEGPILEDALFEPRQDLSTVTRGLVLGGGYAMSDRKLSLIIHRDQKSFQTAQQIVTTINNRFTTVTNVGRVGIAEAKTDGIVDLLIPEAYQNNIGRFTQVISNVAIKESVEDRVNRIDRLEKMMSNREIARVTALRLEAIGKEATPVLIRTLKNPDLEIRFYAAASLAYMGHADGLEILSEVAIKDSTLRWHALAALESLNDIRATGELEKLVHCESAEARYGAFRALKNRNDTSPVVAGEILAKDFYFHVIPSDGNPLLHFSRSKFPEVVVFDPNQTVDDKILYISEGLTIKGLGREQIEICRFTPDGKVRTACSNKVPELIREMAQTGCTYSAVLDFFRFAKQKEQLSAKLAINALPKLGRDRVETPVALDESIESTGPDFETPETAEETPVSEKPVSLLGRRQPSTSASTPSRSAKIQDSPNTK